MTLTPPLPRPPRDVVTHALVSPDEHSRWTDADLDQMFHLVGAISQTTQRLTELAELHNTLFKALTDEAAKPKAPHAKFLAGLRRMLGAP